MLRTRVIPCLLLQEGSLVKTIRFKQPTYIGDPVNTVKIFNEMEVDELLFLDITASTSGRDPDYHLLEKIAGECFMPFTYGGGIRNLEQARALFRLGVEKLSLCSSVVNKPELISEIAAEFGSQSIIVSLDVKKNLFNKYTLKINSGEKNIKQGLNDTIQKVITAGAGEIFVNSIDNDGSMEGFDLDLVKMISSQVDVPVIACGGAGTLSDIGDAVHKAGASAVALGSMVVYQSKKRGILINFPSHEALNDILARPAG